MRNRERFYFIACACLLTSCAASHAPRGWLPMPSALQTESYGGWLKLEYLTPEKKKASLSGELLAINADSVFIAGEDFYVLALSTVKSARLENYQSHSDEISGLTLLGTLSTISNGLLLVFTAPMWIIGGSASAGSRSYEPIIDYPKREWRRLAAFARFPQGLPEGLDRRQIKMKYQP